MSQSATSFPAPYLSLFSSLWSLGTPQTAQSLTSPIPLDCDAMQEAVNAWNRLAIRGFIPVLSVTETPCQEVELPCPLGTIKGAVYPTRDSNRAIASH